jgi:hypothetical protein
MRCDRSPKRPRTTCATVPASSSSVGIYNIIPSTTIVPSLYTHEMHNTPTKKRKRSENSSMGYIFFEDQNDTLMSQIRIEIDDEKTEIVAKHCPYGEQEQFILSLMGPKHPFILQPLNPQPDMSDYEGEWENVVMYELADPISRSIGRMDALSTEDVTYEKIEERLHRLRQFLRQSLGALSVCHSRFIVHNNISLRSSFLAGADKNVKLCGLEHAISFGSDQIKFRTMAQHDLINFALVVAELAFGRKIESHEQLERLLSRGLFSHEKQLTQLRHLIKDLYQGTFATAEDVLLHSFFKSTSRSRAMRETQLREKTMMLLSTIATKNNKRTFGAGNVIDKENLPPSI